MDSRLDEGALGRAWAAEAQALAEKGVVECRMCRRREDLAGALQIWRNGIIVYALCKRCTQDNHILITPTEHGTEVRARRRSPYILRGTG